MAVETVTHIADLDPTKPTGAEPKSQGDDHVRNVKKALKQSFAGLAGAVQVTGTDGGAVNAYTLTPATSLAAYGARMLAVFAPSVTNTGAATLNISGLGAKPILRVDGAPLVANDLVEGRYYFALYDGTQFRLQAVTQNYIDQLVFSGALPGQAGNAGKFLTTDGTSASFVSIDGRGAPTLDKGNSGTTAQVINYAAGEGQTLTVTGACSITTAGWPVGRMAGILLRVINGGAHAITTTGINWIKSDGTQTATFASSGITLQTSGATMIGLFSYGDGIVYGRAV